MTTFTCKLTTILVNLSIALTTLIVNIENKNPHPAKMKSEEQVNGEYPGITAPILPGRCWRWQWHPLKGQK